MLEFTKASLFKAFVAINFTIRTNGVLKYLYIYFNLKKKIFSKIKYFLQKKVDNSIFLSQTVIFYQNNIAYLCIGVFK